MATEAHWGEEPWPEAAGYQALANLMGGYPEMATFRRFRNAGALDLLYRQAELQHSIAEWALTVSDDKQSQNYEHRQYDIRFDLLRKSMLSDSADDSKQWRAWREISHQLGEYYDRLLQFRKICALPCADKHHLQQLRGHLQDSDKGARFLQDVEELVYRELTEGDLTSIASPDEHDLFTKFARGPVINFVHKYTGQNSSHVVTVPQLASNAPLSLWFKEYSPERAIILSRMLYAVLTSLFVTAAIVSLNVVKNAIGRIFLIMLHNLLFTLAMAVFAKGRPGELFGVAAAYSAVLVVYASGSEGLKGTAAS